MSSSLLAASSFDPSGKHYVSAVTALDTHRVRVQSTSSDSSLAHAFDLEKGHKLTCISWGLTPIASSSSKKSKKRRLSNNFNIENQIVSIGLNKGSVLLYSPVMNDALATLENPNAASILDFHFSEITNSAWSVDVGQNVIEWDLTLFKPKTQFKFSESVNIIRIIEYQDKPHLLLASHSISIVDISTKEIVKAFPGHISPIHTVQSINDEAFITAAQGDRFINIYSLVSPNSHVLVAQSEVLSVSYSNGAISAVTEDGIVEVFTNVLTKNSTINNKRRGQQSKQSTSKIHLQRPNEERLKIEGSFITSSILTITWLENGSIPTFERVSIEDLKEELVIKKDRPAIQAKDHSLFGQDLAAPKRYNEGNVTITSGDNLKYLDNKDGEENNAADKDDEDEEGPTLAEKLESLKVESTLPKKKQGRATTGSLVVILTQALRSNDHALLETVLANRDEKVLKATIERLDTSLAVTLLERLAERIARQTNRQGQLNIWVKWIMVVHGGYLISLTNLSKSLSSLHSTLTRRANTLPRLLELQGRLDVLYSQQELNGGDMQVDDDFNDSDESDVEYVEELDDGNLIDDGEQDFYEEDEEGFMNIDDESEEQEDDSDVEMIEKLDDDEVGQEEGYSDEEVNGNGIQASESEDEQELLKDKIAKLKAKQNRRKGN